VGQKTNPKLFRLATNNNFLANWYTSKKEYPNYLKEDNLYIEKINNIFGKIFTLSNINISRKESSNVNFIYFNINILYPREKEIFNKIHKFFSLNKDIVSKKILFLLDTKNKEIINTKRLIFLVLNFLKKKFLNEIDSLNNISFIKINFIKNPYIDSLIIAKIIADQIKKRVPYRRVMKQIIENAKYSLIKGILIKLSGRLNGIEMARSESKRYGTIPLHTLKANIDYTQYEVNTIYGIIGIKIWLHLN
jgi:small subunit ribosomal protein S3